MDVLQLFFVGAVGACVGSFISVLVIRLPAKESVVHKRSRCMSCQGVLPWYALVPIVSYLVLRGRCLMCSKQISAAYIGRETLFSVITILIYLSVGMSWVFVQLMVLSVILITAAEIDLRHGIIPNALIVSGGIFGVILLMLFDVRLVTDYLLVAIVSFIALLSIQYFSKLMFGRIGLGMGDVKLVSMIALFLSWQSMWALYLAVLLGGVFGIAGILMGRLDRGSRIPFAPFIAAGVGGSFYFNFIEVMRWFG